MPRLTIDIDIHKDDLSAVSALATAKDLLDLAVPSFSPTATEVVTGEDGTAIIRWEMTEPWAMDAEGRIFYDGRWIAQASAKEASPHREARTEIRITAVRPSYSFDNDEEMQAMFDATERRARVSFSSVNVPLHDILQARP